jgi:pimeloyl-ACP methyl ester carboxylesterase
MRKSILYSLLSLVTLIGAAGFWAYTPDIPVARLKQQYATPPSQFLDMEGLSVHFRDEGQALVDSIPLVLIHGTSSSLFTWDAWVKELGSAYRIIRLDLPNYALTGSDGKTIFMGPDYAAFVARFLDRLSIKKCYMAGNSLGGEVTWQFARLYPERVEKMILIDAAGMPVAPKNSPVGFRIAHMPVVRDLVKYLTPRTIFESSIRNVYADPTKVTEAQINLYADMTLREGNRAALIRRFKVDKMSYDNHSTNLSNVHTPTLIMWGAQDQLIPLDAAYQFATTLPNDTMVVFPNAGHVPMEELGKESAAAAIDFLRKR